MGFCTKCGTVVPDGNSFCTNCGTPVEAPANNNSYGNSNGTAYNAPYNAPNNQYGNGNVGMNNAPNNYAPAQQQTNGMAIAGFVLSFFFALLGLIFGCIGLNKSKQLGGNGRGLAIAAIVISIISMVLGVIIWSSIASSVATLSRYY